MPLNKLVLGAVLAIVLVLSSIASYVMSRPKPKVPEVVRTKPAATQVKQITTPPTPAPTTAPPATDPPASSSTIIYPDYAAGIIPPPMPYPISMPTPTFVMIPGANFPGLTGLRRDQATTYIITRYPRLVVRAVPMGTQLTYEVRKDRVTLSYDPYTNRIVSARVG